MKRLFGIILIGIIFTGCISMGDIAGNAQFDEGYKIKANPMENRFIVSIESYKYKCQQEDMKAGAELRQPNYNNIDDNHLIIYKTLAFDAAVANPKNWTIIIKDSNGVEIFRGNGDNYYPDININTYSKHITSSFEAYGAISIDKNTSFPIYIRAVNLLNEVIETTISKK